MLNDSISVLFEQAESRLVLLRVRDSARANGIDTGTSVADTRTGSRVLSHIAGPCSSPSTCHAATNSMASVS